MQLRRAIHTRFPCGSVPEELNLAAYIHSPDRSTKSTTSHLRTSALCACKHRVSGSISLPFRGSFHRSFTVLYAIGHQVVFRLGGWSPRVPSGFHVSAGTLDTATYCNISHTGLSPSMACLPRQFRYAIVGCCGPNPNGIATFGLASSPFARRYLGNLG